ncbi:YggS family pyridoxal phosphate-dependent enzyme [Geotalea sp. SG265]|uniref:YggS family pyridoxal phosphate-dependent enzyme n=1 Tax=Geotalea sp. SG265 TaxID=2922867 RepID=UPI001FB01530|nr:YggS family pyridoxal phosphate-dependent enzyme [Geotalea sp. SG265]
MSIAGNLGIIEEKIAAAAVKAGRAPSSVRLVAVSKMQSAAAVDAAARAGQRLFGENYVQELAAKSEEVRESVTWHFIGSLQSNKVRLIAGLVTMIHSVDRLSLAQEIDRQWGRLGKVCDVLVQVNVSGESTKSGSSSGQVLDLVRDISRLSHVRIKGLMTMPPFFDDPEGARPFFRELRRLSGLIGDEGIANVEMTELSMGMSGDFQVAIEEGATLVRIGSAIFGERIARVR